MKIKLCGMFRDCDIDFANEARPDYIGFILGFPKSHRNIGRETAQRLRSRLSPEIKAVGVFVNSPETTCAEYANCGIIDVIQLHGQEDADYIRRLRGLTGAPIIKAAKIRTPEDIRSVQALGADYVLLDNGTGTGEMFDHCCFPALRYASRSFLPGDLPRTICGRQRRISDRTALTYPAALKRTNSRTVIKCWR